MSSYWYRAFGLAIESELALPIPQSAASAPDVRIRVGAVGLDEPDDPASKSLLRATPREICIRLESAAKVMVRDGREIIVEPLEGVEHDVLATWVQSAALSLVLHQRGNLVMHASAVAIGDGAVCFVGECGWGKSTTAAALDARGNQLLCDDLVAIQTNSGIPTIMAGIPHLKLTPQSLEFLGEESTNLAMVAGDGEKRYRISQAPLPSMPIPLRAVYILGEGDSCRIDPLPPQKALLELMCHAFVARKTEFLRSTGTSESHFKSCAAVVNSAAVCRLSRPKKFDLLPMLVELVETHAQLLSRTKASA